MRRQVLSRSPCLAGRPELVVKMFHHSIAVRMVGGGLNVSYPHLLAKGSPSYFSVSRNCQNRVLNKVHKFYFAKNKVRGTDKTSGFNFCSLPASEKELLLLCYKNNSSQATELHVYFRYSLVPSSEPRMVKNII
jgi:hypothetical protein